MGVVPLRGFSNHLDRLPSRHRFPLAIPLSQVYRQPLAMPIHTLIHLQDCRC